jgi:argininosuccinate synthase
MKVTDLKGKTIAFAASGGLDSCTITRWLTDNGVNVICFTVDLAQPDEEDINDIKARMIASGAKEHVLVDGREAIARAGLQVIQSQATYEGGYWNTTGIARHVTVEAIIPEMKKRGIAVFSHGATGRGNDQVRFQLCMNMLAPEVEVYAPWRDEAFLSKFPGRSEMIDFCEAQGIPVKASKSKPYSTDANLLGLTHEAGVLESLETPTAVVSAQFGKFAKDCPDQSEKFTVVFENGVPTLINGKKVSVFEAFLSANQIGGRNGVGIGVHVVENRFVGIKSRGVYEMPGIELLGKCYEYLLQLTLDRRARELFDATSRFVSKQIYQGYFFDLASQMAMSTVRKAAEMVSGEVEVELYKGSINYLAARDSKHSLYSEADASMEGIGTYDHKDAEGLIRVWGVSARAVARSGQAAKGL